MDTGVYAILNTTNGKMYIGSSASSLKQRWRDHRASLRKNEHSNKHLQAAWNVYGESAFKFVILQGCPPQRCLIREQYWLDTKQVNNRRYGYNKRKVANSNLGLKKTEAQSRRHSEIMKEYYQSDEARKRTGESTRKTWQDPVTREKRAAGIKKSYENPKRREAQRNILTRPDVRQKIAAALGTEEARERNRKMQKTLWSGPAYKEKMKQIHRERCSNPEEIQRMKKAANKQWADPEQRRKKAETMRRLWADPVYREAMLARRKRG